MSAEVWSDHDGDGLFWFRRPAWQAEGACRGLDPDLFFPQRGQSLTTARAVCAACPVKEECLDFAVEHHEEFGVWGGSSERERRQLRRQRRAERPAA